MTRRPASGHVARRELTAQDAETRRARVVVTVGTEAPTRLGARSITRGSTRADSGLEDDDVEVCDEPPFGYARPERWR